ncbi:MAG: hypothetical protein IIB25_00065 [Chloroflexi bacterium]|nr:hypothetical protein [Chloroflexota bacterium]
MQALYKPIALLSIVSLILASTLTAAPVSADSHDSSHIPRGQLTRRGLTGTVVGLGGSSFVLETKFGNVTISVDGDTIVKSRGENVGFGAVSVGDRVGVLLDKPPDAPATTSTAKTSDDDDDEPDVTPPANGDDTGTEPDVTPTPTATPELTPPANGDDTGTEPDQNVDLTVQITSDDTGTEPDVTPTPTPEPSFRQGVTALRIIIVPSRASRSHQRGVVTSKGQGKVRFIDENGDEQELDGDADANEGDDVIFITRGRGGGRVAVTGSTDPSDIDDRLTRLAESNPDLAAKITEKKAAAQTRREERLANTFENAPDDKKGGVRGAIERNKDRSKSSGHSDGGGTSGRGGNNSGRGGGNSDDGGNSGRGGGNSGRGGGNSDDGANSGRGNSGGGGGRGRG